MDDLFRSLDEEETISEEPDEPADDFFSKTGERVMKSAEEVGDKLLDEGEKFSQKAKEAAGKAGEKFKDVSEDVGEKLFEHGGKALDRAREEGSKMWKKASDWLEKTQEEADKEAAQEEKIRQEAEKREAEYKSKAADKDADSTLGGMDSFFEKAKRYAEGDYHGTGKSEISRDPEHKPKKKEGQIPGFEDRDGDGDELIDDAILDDDDKE